MAPPLLNLSHSTVARVVFSTCIFLRAASVCDATVWALISRRRAAAFRQPVATITSITFASACVNFHSLIGTRRVTAWRSRSLGSQPIRLR